MKPHVLLKKQSVDRGHTLSVISKVFLFICNPSVTTFSAFYILGSVHFNLCNRKKITIHCSFSSYSFSFPVMSKLAGTDMAFGSIISAVCMLREKKIVR